jgi:hypothetical protein
MPKQGDRVQREIEELLGSLDNFVPEERFISKVKSRRKAEAGPSIFARAWAVVSRPFRKITLGHVMLLGLGLVVTAWLFGDIYGDYRGIVSLVGTVMIIVAFVMSFLGWDSRRTIAGGPVQRRWRGQVIEYNDAPPASGIKGWFRNLRRR